MYHTKLVNHVDHVENHANQKKLDYAQIHVMQQIYGRTVENCIKHGLVGCVIQQHLKDYKDRKIVLQLVHAKGKYLIKIFFLNLTKSRKCQF